MLALEGKCLFNFSEGGRIFFPVLEHDFFGFHGRGGEAANARQRLPSATHEVNTQTPCTQGNMRGVVAVFDVSFV